MIEYLIIFLAVVWAVKQITETIYYMFKIYNEGILVRRERIAKEQDLKS